MADRTTHLSMPFILPSQSQKHVTHNEALLALDAVVQMAVEGEISTPPSAATEGSRFIVATGASDDWAGHDGHIATLQDGAWSFRHPKEGWLAWFSDTQKLKVFHASRWQVAGSDATPSMLGVNTDADNYNRLAVASDASLFTHSGNGHQAKINKAAATDAAAMLFQSNWIGHAEIGLLGDNDLSFKMNNGTDWVTALKIRQDGTITQPLRPAARAYKDDGIFSPASGSESGFTRLDHVQGGISLLNGIGRTGQTIRIPSDGLYLISLLVTVTASSGHATSVLRNRAEILFTLSAPAFAPLSLSHTQATFLSRGDELSLHHAGTAQISNAAGVTQLTLAML